MQTIVVTKHKALVEYLLNIKLIDKSTPVIHHASAADVAGRHVIGILPYWLAAKAERITEIQLHAPPEKYGQELTLDEVTQYASEPRTYEVRAVKQEYQI